MSAPLYLVIMAGGSGTRFWPKSTSKKPKQLLSFGAGQPTLLGQTLSRFDGIVPGERRIIVTTRALEPAIREQASGATVLGEPQGRNTAPCVYWAAREIARKDPGAIMLVMPADHYMARPEAFRETVRAAAAWAETHDDLVTLGVKPVRPETGYGYLKVGAAIAGECRKVEAFVEKPSLDRAQAFVSSGTYLWNGGMFIWSVKTILEAFDRSMPEMKKAWDALAGDVTRAYPQMTATSIDYGVMEKAANVVTFTLDCGWDDLGSWTSLEDLGERLGGSRSEAGVVTAGELIAVDSRGNVVDTPGKLTAILGVSDLIVVEAGGALLIASKSRAQDIRAVVEKVKAARPELA